MAQIRNATAGDFEEVLDLLDARSRATLGISEERDGIWAKPL